MYQVIKYHTICAKITIFKIIFLKNTFQLQDWTSSIGLKSRDVRFKATNINHWTRSVGLKSRDVPKTEVTCVGIDALYR